MYSFFYEGYNDFSGVTPPMKFDDALIRRVKLRELRVLLAAAQCRSLVKAAENLGMTQPAASKAISDLEDTLRVRLFDRTHAGVVPTAQGKIVLQRALNILDEIKLTREELDDFANPGAGTFVLGCAHAVSVGLVPHVLDDLCKDHPRVRCQVLETDPEQIVTVLRKREIDIVLARPPVEDAADLQFEKLYDEKLFVVAGAHHSLASRRRISRDELAAQRWILPARDTAVGRLTEAMFLKQGIRLPDPNIVSNSIQVTTSLLHSGRFLALLPVSVLAFHPMRISFRVLPLPDIQTRASGPVGILTVRHRDLVPAARLFSDYARKAAAFLAAFDVRYPSRKG